MNDANKKASGLHPSPSTSNFGRPPSVGGFGTGCRPEACEGHCVPPNADEIAALLAQTARADAQRFVVLMLTRAASEHLKMADELRDAAARVRL